MTVSGAYASVPTLCVLCEDGANEAQAHLCSCLWEGGLLWPGDLNNCAWPISCAYSPLVSIFCTAERRPQHGSLLQVVDMGETALDEDTFNEYLSEISSHYTADKVSFLRTGLLATLTFFSPSVPSTR